MKLLLVKLSALGDIVHAFPAVEEARQRVPGLTIDWVVEPKHAGLIDELGGLARRRTPQELFADLRARRVRYDAVIDAQGLLRSAWLARRSGAPVTGAGAGQVREWPAQWAYHHRVALVAGHAVDDTRQLFGALLGYAVHPRERRSDSGARRGARLAQRRVLLFHGTAQRCKLWPLDCWIVVAEALVGRGYVPVVTAQGGEEAAFCRALCAAVPATRFLTEQSIAMLRAEIAAAALAISVDTGLGHFADWLGCPTLMLFQASDPQRTGTYFAQSRSIWAGSAPTRPARRERGLPPRHSIPETAAVLAVMEEMLQ